MTSAPRSHGTPARIAIAAICLTLWFIALPRPLLGNWRSYTPDSASYVEASRSFLAGSGFMSRPRGGCEPRIWIPLDLWPPGFPAMMAAAQAAGAPAPESGVLLSLVASGLFVVLCALIASALLGGTLGVLVPAAIAVMPALTVASGMCWSDGPYLLLAAASLVCLTRARRVARGAWWMALGGLLAGLAWGVRYVGVALIAAEALFLLAAVITGSRRWSASAAWALGCAAGASFFVLRNLTAFGHLMPYDLGPASASPGSALRQIAEAAALGLGGGARYMGVSHFVPGVALAAVVAAGALAIAAILIRRALGRRAGALSTLAAHGDAALLATYSLLYVLVVGLASLRYQWGEPIGTRHLLQVFWIVWMLVAYGALRLGGRLERVARAALTITLLSALALYLHADRWWDRHTNRATPDVIASGLADSLLHEVGARGIVLSCEAFVLRIHGVNARQMGPAEEVEACLGAAGPGAMWGIVIEDLAAARAGVYGPTVQGLAEHPGQVPGFRPWGHGADSSHAGDVRVFQRVSTPMYSRQGPTARS